MINRKAKATYTFQQGRFPFEDRAIEVEADGPPVRGLVVNVRPSWGSPPTEQKRWNITHAQSGLAVLKGLDRITAVAVRDKLAELADWDLPASAFQKRNLESKGTLRHWRIAKIAKANPREFARNGGGMERA